MAVPGVAWADLLLLVQVFFGVLTEESCKGVVSVRGLVGSFCHLCSGGFRPSGSLVISRTVLPHVAIILYPL